MMMVIFFLFEKNQLYVHLNDIHYIIYIWVNDTVHRLVPSKCLYGFNFVNYDVTHKISNIERLIFSFVPPSLYAIINIT